MNSKSKKNIYFLFFKFWTKQIEIKQGMRIFSGVASVSDEAFVISTLQQCWDSWMSAMYTTKISGIATVKYKHTANKSNIKYQGLDADGLKQFSQITSLIKMQHSEQYM